MLSTTEFIDNGIRYYVYNNRYVTIGNELSSPDLFEPSAAVNSSSVVGELVIHERFNNIPIANFSKAAFSRCTELKKVIILANIETIPERCFADCRNLLYIEIPSSVKSLGENAIQFYNISQPNQSTIHSTVLFCSGSQLTSISRDNFAYVSKVTIVFQSKVNLETNSYHFTNTSRVVLYCNEPMQLGSVQSLTFDLC